MQRYIILLLTIKELRMNFLAHLYLSCQEEELLIGNFVADFILNKEVKNFSNGVQRGILLHREIDSFTDSHKEVRKGTKRLQKNHGKYSPVVIDILYDYVLANNWDKYHGLSLEEFAFETYDKLNKHIALFPPKLQRRLPLMIGDNFLMKYKSKDGLLFALSSMDKRTKFPSNFISAIDQLENEWELFNSEFNAFFPDVKLIADGYCGC